MPGNPPPPDAPSADEQDSQFIDAGFSASQPAVSLCGFKLPLFLFHLSIKLPSFSIPWPPTFSFSIGINCDLNNPLNVSGGIGFGGGRVASLDPDPDDKAAEDYANGP